MNKFKITIGNKIIEFATESEAQAFLDQNNLTATIEEVFEIINSSNVPQVATSRQVREAMTIISYQTGNLALHPDNILAFLKSMPPSIEKDIAIQNWEYSNEFIRYNPLITQMAPALGLTDESIDQLFILAATRGV